MQNRILSSTSLSNLSYFILNIPCGTSISLNAPKANIVKSGLFSRQFPGIKFSEKVSFRYFYFISALKPVEMKAF